MKKLCIPLVTLLVLPAVLTLLLLPVEVSAQSWQFGKNDKAKYRTPAGPWRDADIEISPGLIEVFSRRDRVLVAKFTDATIHNRVQRRRRTKTAAYAAGAGFGLLAGAYWAAKSKEGELVVNDGDVYQRTIDAKRVGIFAAAVTGITVAIALTKSNDPYVEVISETRSTQLRVDKKHRMRFEDVLESTGFDFE